MPPATTADCWEGTYEERKQVNGTSAFLYNSGMAIPRWQGWAKGAKEKLDEMLSEAA